MQKAESRQQTADSRQEVSASNDLSEFGKRKGRSRRS
jgi:hypothetical protein